MRHDIMFDSQGLRCAGWLYIPDNLIPGEKAPAIVMAHGLTCVKEMYLSNFAERFTEAGFVALVFDYRYFGASEGEPRCQLFAQEQQEDYRNAITWISDHPQVDSERIGLWGTSYSGGVVMYVGTFDKRVKAVVAQAPSALNWESRRSLNPEQFDRAGEMLIRDRIERYRSGKVNYLKVVACEKEPCVLPGEEAYEWYTRASGSAPNWRNQVTLASLEKAREFDPISLIHLLSPCALLMVVAEHDSLIPQNLLVSAYERAKEPKAMTTLSCGHFDLYTEPWVEKSAGAAVEWFTGHLRA